MNQLLVVTLAICFAAPGAGCAGKAKRTEDFMSSVRTYNDGVRWQRYPQAANHVSKAERDAFLAERDELDDDLELGDWEIVNVEYDGPERRRADVFVRYTWYLDSEGLVNETTAKQRWELRGKRWIMSEEHRASGPAMPGVPEPPEEPAKAPKPPQAASMSL